METKAKIKVIKKDSAQEFKIRKHVEAKTKTAQPAARDMVSTVSGWVTEFQQKRREETKEAFKLLFEVRQPGTCANC
ncbi:MAG: hypothetical protein M3209_14665 [Acidobacteriota bacterium]|nr:hypothetical protein [Acidobacteriota bacterium]